MLKGSQALRAAIESGAPVPTNAAQAAELAKYTPGPLYAIPDEVGIAWHICTRKDDDERQPDYKRTARTTDSENARADAFLYAAAPELLEALLELAPAADAMLCVLNERGIENEKAKRGCKAIAAAYAAIAKATGGAK